MLILGISPILPAFEHGTLAPDRQLVVPGTPAAEIYSMSAVMRERPITSAANMLA